MQTLSDLFVNAIKDFNFHYDKIVSAWLISGEIVDICRVDCKDTMRFRDGSTLTVDNIEGAPAPLEDCNDV